MRAMVMNRSLIARRSGFIAESFSFVQSENLWLDLIRIQFTLLSAKALSSGFNYD
jgi:hypothetical protein